MTDTVTRENNELVFSDKWGKYYAIDLTRCTTSEQILYWIIQVSKKKYITSEFLGLIVRALDKELDIHVNIYSLGVDMQAGVGRSG